MSNLSKLAALAGLVAVIASPAFAKTDCDTGFTKHMAAMSTYTQSVPANDLAEAIRKSLDAYDSCKAGDSFSPHGVWDQIEADMKAKAGK